MKLTKILPKIQKLFFCTFAVEIDAIFVGVIPPFGRHLILSETDRGTQSTYSSNRHFVKLKKFLSINIFEKNTKKNTFEKRLKELVVFYISNLYSSDDK